MKRTYIFPQVSFETLNTQSSIMAGSDTLKKGGKTSDFGNVTIKAN